MYITGGRRMEPCWHQSWHWQAELSLSPSLSSGKLNSITHSRDREKQKTQSSEENPLPSARRLHMSPSTSVRLFFFFFFLVIRFFHTSRRRRDDDSGIRIEYFHETCFFFSLQWRWMAYSTLSRSISFQGIYLWRYLCEGSDKRGTNFSVCVVVFGWWWFFRTLVLWYFRRRAQLSPPSTHQPTIDEEEAEEEEPSMEFYYQDIPSLFTRQVIFTSPICSNKCVCGYIWKGNRLLLAVGAMMIGPPSLLCLRLSRPYFIKTAQWRDKKRSTRISPDAITIGMLWNCLASEKKLFKLLITRRARIVKAEWLEGSNEGGKNTAAGRPSPSETHKNAAALTIHNSLSPGACVYIIIHFPAGPPLHLSTLFIFLFFFAKLKRNLICYRS